MIDAGGDETIFESQPALDLRHAQGVCDLAFGVAGPVACDHFEHSVDNQVRRVAQLCKFGRRI